MYRILIGVLLFGALAMNLVREFSLERWVVTIILIVFSAVLYIANVLLIKYYIQKNAPEFSGHDEILPGLQEWEITAGTGMVPKWVSWLGLLAISAILAALLPWIIMLI